MIRGSAVRAAAGRSVSPPGCLMSETPAEEARRHLDVSAALLSMIPHDLADIAARFAD